MTCARLGDLDIFGDLTVVAIFENLVLYIRKK